MRALLAAAAALACLAAAARAQSAVLDADAPWIVSTDDYHAGNAPLLRALGDLKRDWAAVLGARPALLNALPPQPVRGSMDASRVTSVLMGINAPSRGFLQPVLPLAPQACTAGAEAHCVYAAPDPYFGGVAIVAIGWVEEREREREREV